MAKTQMNVLLFVLLYIKSCSALFGEFYGEESGDGVIFLDNDSMEVDVGSFRFFDSSNENIIKVYKYGVIGIGEGIQLPECPVNLHNTNLRYIAPYWAATTSGSVSYQIRQNTENDQQFTRMATDIKKTFPNANINVDSIDRAVIVTWKNMTNDIQIHPRFPYRPQNHGNTFQAVLVIQNEANHNAAYVFFIYGLISYTVIVDQGECNVVAEVGIGAGNVQFNYPLSQTFFQRNIAAISFTTNIPDFQQLGRFAFSLSPDGELPPYPRTNCIGDNPDPICLSS